MPREQWVGYIKDYDGGTLMEYVIHPKIPYADLVGMFRVGAASSQLDAVHLTASTIVELLKYAACNLHATTKAIMPSTVSTRCSVQTHAKH